MTEELDRRTLAMASAILIITTTAGLLTVGPVGIIIGPVVDRFVTPRILSRRNYRSPGAPLWSAAIGGIALIPAIASGADVAADRDIAVLSAVSAALGAIILGLIALRTPLAKLGAIGIGLGVAAAAVALTLASQAG
jgi:hypothetical protein